MPHRCDFCGQQPVVWYYHVMPMPIALADGSFSRDDWAACSHCKGLIDREAFDELAGHMNKTYPWNPWVWCREMLTDFSGLKNGPGIAA